MDVANLVSRFTSATAGIEPQYAHKAAVSVMNELKSELDDVAEALSYLTGSGGNALQAFYRAPNLSMLKVRFPDGRRTPPHDHGTWASILVLSGSEKNSLYTRHEDASLTYDRTVELERGSVIFMPANAVHVAECTSSEPAIGLHVYGGNVLGLERHMWDPDTLAEQELDWSKYEGLAQRASAASAAPLT
ncbi:MAG: putative metal-dependent enzyme (double-stranded beta helix superfamily) [Alphaproteobacteria bacterium]|jgi:predicted metal-dependent enzyme (double-stranded beta helix superfamily)